MSPLDALQSYIDSLPIVDTHSHAAGFDYGTPINDREGLSLPQLLMNDYLRYLAFACATHEQAKAAHATWAVDDAERHYEAIKPVVAHFSSLTTYGVLREGIRRLYPFDDDDINDQNWAGLNRRIVHAYRKHGQRAWLRAACRRLGVVKQNQMCAFTYVAEHLEQLPEAEREAQRELLLPSLIIDQLAFTGLASGVEARQRAQRLLGCEPRDYHEYIDFCASLLDRFVELGGASVKILCAYVRPIRFARVPDDRAAELFARGHQTLAEDDLTALQDNLIWRLLVLAHERGLPLIVHTGYSTPMSHADPEHLLNILQAPELHGMKVDVSHSGWPNEGGAMMMARSYPGAYINLCWTPMLSESIGRRVLGEVIDMVPSNKILIGTDCGSVESFVGTVLLIRSMLAEVLADKVQRGQFGMEVARHVARAILWDNACDFYGERFQRPDMGDEAQPESPAIALE